MRKLGPVSFIASLALIFFVTSLPNRNVWGEEPVPNLQKSLFRKMGILLFDDHEKAPVWSIPDLSGKTITLDAFRGRLVLLNFWATWCVPCRKEIPTLNQLNRKMAGQSFVLASIAMDHDIQHIQAFMKKVPVDYLVLAGRRGKIDSRYFGLGIPQTYLIDADGYLLGKVIGPRDWQSPSALGLIRSLLPKRTAGTSSPAQGFFQ